MKYISIFLIFIIQSIMASGPKRIIYFKPPSTWTNSQYWGLKGWDNEWPWATYDGSLLLGDANTNPDYVGKVKKDLIGEYSDRFGGSLKYEALDTRTTKIPNDNNQDGYFKFFYGIGTAEWGTSGIGASQAASFHFSFTELDEAAGFPYCYEAYFEASSISPTYAPKKYNNKNFTITKIACGTEYLVVQKEGSGNVRYTKNEPCSNIILGKTLETLSSIFNTPEELCFRKLSALGEKFYPETSAPVVFNLHPNDGWEVESVSLNGVPVTVSNNEVTVSSMDQAIDENVLKVVFKPIVFRLVLKVTGAGDVYSLSKKHKLVSSTTASNGDLIKEYAIPYKDFLEVEADPYDGMALQSISETFLSGPNTGTVNVLSKVPTDGSSYTTTYDDLSADLQYHVVFEECEGVRIGLKPNRIYTKHYKVDGTTSYESMQFFDDYGEAIQSQRTYLNKRIVTADYDDDLGRGTEVTLPFMEGNKDLNFVDMKCKNCLARSNAWYNGAASYRPLANGKAYSEAKYKEGLGNELQAVGQPGKSFSAHPIEGSPAKIWVVGRGSKALLNSADLTVEKLDKRQKTSANPKNAKYILTISSLIDQITKEEYFSQSITDLEGNVVKTWSSTGTSSVVHSAEYDDLNRVVSTRSATGLTYENNYTKAHEVESSISPDAGKVSYVYDDNGRILQSQTAKQKARSTSTNIFYNYYVYDSQQRVIAVYEARGAVPLGKEGYLSTLSNGQILQKNIFDALDLSGIVLDPVLTADLTANIKTISGASIGTILYFENGSEWVAKFNSYVSASVFEATYTLSSSWNIPPQKTSISIATDFSVSGVTYSTWNGTEWVSSIEKSFHKDAYSRLSEVRHFGQKTISYQYNEDGSLASSSWFPLKKAGSLTLKSEGDIRGLLSKIELNGTSNEILYSQEVQKRDASGKILEQNFRYNKGSEDVYHEQIYDYDKVGRLVVGRIAASNTNVGAEPSEDINTKTLLHSTYSYDNDDRFLSKKEGSSFARSYTYESGTSHLVSVMVGEEGATGGVLKNRNFIYDPDGNVVWDGYRKAAYRYSWQGLVSKVLLFENVPVGLKTWKDIEALLASTIYEATGQILNRVDANNQYVKVSQILEYVNSLGANRLAKKSIVYSNSTSKTYFRLYGHGLSTWSKASLSAPFVPEQMFYSDIFGVFGVAMANGTSFSGTRDEYFFAKDQIGTIRAIVKNGDMIAASDRFPYGAEIGVLANADASLDKIIQSFSGKEYEVNKDNPASSNRSSFAFGYRDYDPQIGRWLQKDPMQEFSDGYNYVGGDPINSFDPDGRYSASLSEDVYFRSTNGSSPKPRVASGVVVRSGIKAKGPMQEFIFAKMKAEKAAKASPVSAPATGGTETPSGSQDNTAQETIGGQTEASGSGEAVASPQVSTGGNNGPGETADAGKANGGDDSGGAAGKVGGAILTVVSHMGGDQGNSGDFGGSKGYGKKKGKGIKLFSGTGRHTTSEDRFFYGFGLVPGGVDAGEVIAFYAWFFPIAEIIDDINTTVELVGDGHYLLATGAAAFIVLPYVKSVALKKGAGIIDAGDVGKVDDIASKSTKDVTKRPSGFRKKTVQDAWDNAQDVPGGKSCPTCKKTVKVEPHSGNARDWDVDHQPPWSKRNLEGLDRKGVLDNYNKGTRLECPGCNRSRGNR